MACDGGSPHVGPIRSDFRGDPLVRSAVKLSIVPENEGARLAALQRYELVDPDDDPAMDRITEMVCTVLNVPLASLTVVGRQDMWSISCCGVDRTAIIKPMFQTETEMIDFDYCIIAAGQFLIGASR